MPAIQDAIDTADPGDTICLLEGTYEPTKTFSEGDNVLIDKPLRITGSGEGSLIRIPDNFSSTDGVNLVRSDDTVEWVQIDNIKIDGNRQNNATSASNDGHNLKPQGGNVFVHNVVSVNSTGDGIAGSGDNLNISNNRVEDSYENNIHVNRGENVIISNNTVRGEQDSSSIRYFPVNTSNTVQNAIIDGNTVLDANKRAIEVQSADATFGNIRVSNNIIDNAGTFGIRVLNGSGTLDAVVSDNNVQNCGSYSITVRQLTDSPSSRPEFELRDNTVSDGGADGIYCQLQNNAECLVAGNTVKSHTGNGIKAEMVDNPVDRVVIRENNCLDNNTNGGGSNGIHIVGGGIAHRFVSLDHNLCESLGSTKHDNGFRWDNTGSVSQFDVIRNHVRGFAGQDYYDTATPSTTNYNVPPV
jgi:hypothetical protein